MTYLLCCDWGTSRFRLRLMDTTHLACVGDVLSPAGIAATFDGWKRVAGSGISREQFFRQQLGTQIDRLATRVTIPLAHIPVVISGMASSSIGMDEVPYATLPFALDGSQASIRQVAAQDDFPHEILLISGVCSQQDVMRGEETQLIGLVSMLNLRTDKTGDALFIFPGTHAKHMAIRAGQLVNFATYMTGELFDLLANQSILKDSVDVSNPDGFDEFDPDAFRRGVDAAQSSALLNQLFTVRTNQLFDKLTKKQNALYLSGLLIGTELQHLPATETGPIVLCSGNNLSGFYARTIEIMGLTNRTVVVPPDLVDQASSVGQVLLFQNQLMYKTAK